MQEELRKYIDELGLKVCTIKNLSLLLEDYFYENIGNKKFMENQSLSSVIVEKVGELDESLNALFELTYIEEKRVTEWK